jgi:hypothetical protein
MQMARNPIGAFVDFAIGPALAPANNGYRVRRSRRLPLEQFMSAKLIPFQHPMIHRRLSS